VDHVGAAVADHIELVAAEARARDQAVRKLDIVPRTREEELLDAGDAGELRSGDGAECREIQDIDERAGGTAGDGVGCLQGARGEIEVVVLPRNAREIIDSSRQDEKRHYSPPQTLLAATRAVAATLGCAY